MAREDRLRRRGTDAAWWWDGVNPIDCTGHGVCAELLPELISLDEWGYPIVGPAPGAPGPGPRGAPGGGGLPRPGRSS